jgi:hypothetical protein
VPEGPRPADLVITGRIATLSGVSGFGWAEALAIGGGRVVAVGSTSDVEPFSGPATVQWRLQDDVVVTPSLTDSHLHLAEAALAAGRPDLNGLDLERVAAAVGDAHGERLQAGDRDGWLLGHGWSLEALGGRPEAVLLDASAPGRPVALWSHDHHTRWLSSEAIRRSGVAALADPPSGRIERGREGRPTGILVEHAAGLVDAAIPGPAAHEVEAAIRGFARVLAGLGVTSVHDPGELAPDPKLRRGPTLFRAMACAGDLPLRVTACVREEQLERALETGFETGRAEVEPGSRRYRDGWLKLFADGALGSRTAALLEDYEPGDPAGPPIGGARGVTLRTREQLVALAARAAEAGIASAIHAIGDAAVRTALDVLAEVPGVPGARHRIEHAQLVHPQDVTRFAALAVAASVQPCHLLTDAPSVRAAWGRRSAIAFPLAALSDAGTLLPFGTDAPVESPDPWPGIAAAVLRRGPDWPHDAAFHPEQAVSLARALRGASLDGPRSAGRADEGHLDVGARADLPGPPFDEARGAPSAKALAAIRPLATLLDGTVVHRAPGFDP